MPWKETVLQAAGLWVVTRLTYFVFTYFAVTLNSQRTGGPVSLRSFPPSALLSAWQRWDVNWYLDIALRGYHTAQTAAFFPLYPMLTHVLIVLLGTSHALLAAMIVSNLATLGAFIGLGLLARSEEGRLISPLAITALAAYPLAFFTVAGYSDSLFLAMCVWSLLSARRGWWPQASAFAFLAAVSRPVGVVLILPLAWEYLRQHRDLWPALRTRLTPRIAGEASLVVGAVPLGLAVWGLYLWHRFGNPLMWAKAQRGGWDHQTVFPWDAAQLGYHALQGAPAWSFVQSRILIDVAPVIVFGILTLVAIRLVPISFTLYMLSVMALLVTSVVPLDFDPFNAEGRYLIMSVPIFLLLGRWMGRYPWVNLLVVCLGFMLQALFTAYWLRGGWIV